MQSELMRKSPILALALAAALLAVSPVAAQVAAAPPDAPPPPPDPNVDALDGTAYASLNFQAKLGYAAFGPAGPYMPERAMRYAMWGYAVLACHVGADLKLTDCDPVKESIRDFGFAEAALHMAQIGWVTSAKPDADQPHTDDGRILARVDFKPGGVLLTAKGDVGGVALTPVQYAAAAPAYFPARAFRADISGYALLACRLGADSRFSDCDVRKETPADYGFGDGALRMAAAGAVTAAKTDAETAHTPQGKVLICVLFKSRLAPD